MHVCSMIRELKKQGFQTQFYVFDPPYPPPPPPLWDQSEENVQIKHKKIAKYLSKTNVQW